MASDVTQIKVTIPNPLLDYLASKAGKFGLTLSAYVKHLIVNDVKDMDYPTYQMSEKTEKVMEQALKDYKAGKAKEITDIDKFLNSL
jgi:predicted DNA binding CopG/RHH family protein